MRKKPIRGLQTDAGQRASATLGPATPDIGLWQLLIWPCPASTLTCFMRPSVFRKNHDRIAEETESRDRAD
jgi:hypothetical protein